MRFLLALAILLMPVSAMAVWKGGPAQTHTTPKAHHHHHHHKAPDHK